jgi:hypothetical protein
MKIQKILVACSLFISAIGCRSARDDRYVIDPDPPPNRLSFRSGGFLPEGDLGARGVAPESGITELRTTARVALHSDTSLDVDGTAILLTPEDGGPLSKLVVVVDRAPPGTYEVQLADGCVPGETDQIQTGPSDATIAELIVDETGRGAIEAVIPTRDPVKRPAVMMFRAGTRRIDIARGRLPDVLACSVMPLPPLGDRG